MKGDYIYCLNPFCNKLYKDIYDLPDSRNPKVKSLCPYCKGTNTTNANVIISNTPRWTCILKTDEMTKDQVSQWAKELKELRIIKSYKIYRKKNIIYLYDASDFKKEILKQAEKQNIYIAPITNKEDE